MAEKKEDVSAGLLIQLQRWRESAMEKPLRIMICGLCGAGKSTLVNNLLQLEEGEKWAEEGRRGGINTTIVRGYEKKTKRGLKVSLFDTPGFEDPDLSSDDIITMMKEETNDEVHLVFYCISLSGSTRVQEGDIRVFKTMQIFSDKIWENTVIVLTFANELAAVKKDKDQYLSVIGRITDEVKRVLKKDISLRENVVDKIPIVTAGHTEPKLPDVDKWDDRLFLKALEQVDPEVLLTLLETRIDWKSFIAGGALGAIVGAIGGAIGSLAGPIGATVGTAAGFGAVAGGGGGVAMTKVIKIIAYKYRTRKIKSKCSQAPYQETRHE